MFKHKKLSLGIALAFGGLGLLGSAVAQQAQRVEITGSNIKRVDAETLQPVVTIRREDIERSGKTTLNEVLQSMPVVSGGSFSEATAAGNSFAPGTASISLRGLGVNTTLILLNGRRIANYGFAQNLNENFVDLNSIPVSAVDRIDILKDGASAIYGSDAIAGVVNVILRKDFRAVELHGSQGFAQQGGGAETRAGLTAGFGDLGVNGFNAMVTLDYYKRDKIAAVDREFSKSAIQTKRGPGGRDVRSPTGNPGYFSGGTGNVPTPFSSCPADRVVPGASLGVGSGNVCAYDFASANALVPDTERVGLLGVGTFQLNKDIQLFGELMLNRNETGNYSAPTPAAFSLPAAHPDRPAGSTFTQVAYRFVEAGDRLTFLTTDAQRMLVGARGTLGRFDFELGLMSSRSETESVGRNYIIQERANEAFAGTLAGFAGQYYRVINPSLNSAAMLEAIKISPVRTGTSKLEAADARISTELFAMAGGQAAMAAGLETRKESVADTPDWRVDLRNAARVTVAGSGGTAVEGSRRLTSAFVELSLPFFKGLETQFALRTDDYSDFGRATTPKIGFSLRPASNVLIRGGAAKGFRAPSLAEMFLGESTSFPSVRDAPRCAAYRAGPLGPNDSRTLAVCGGASGNGATAQVRSIFLGNRSLQPEKSESYSLGIVFEPITNLSIAADAYMIEHTNRILAPTAAFILSNEALFPGAVTRNAPSADDVAANAPGSLRGVSGDLTPGITRSFFNASQQRTHGIDLEVRYRWNLGANGRLDLSNAVTYMGSLKRQLNPGQPLAEIADSFQYPRWRNVTTGTWTTGPWSATASLNYIGDYEDNFSVGTPAVYPRVKAMATLDLNFTYTGIKNLTVSVGGQNVTNEDPPFSNLDWYGYDPGTHSNRGAFWYGRLKYRF